MTDYKEQRFIGHVILMVASCCTGPMELSLVLCSDAFIQELNKEYRGKDSPTDVLSFEIEDGVPGYYLRVLGDLIISLDTAQRQATERQ